MSRKPTYEELEQRVRELEKEPVGFKGVGEGLKKVASATTVDIDRKRAEEALKQSEEKYRTILESIEDGYFETDIAGNLTFLNDSLCRIFGYRKDELMGMNIRQFTDQANARKLYQITNNVYKTGKPARAFDYEIIRKEDGRRHVEASISLIKDSQDQTIGFRGIIRDVTEKRHMEAELIHTKNFLQNILDSSIDGIIATDLQGRVISTTLNIKDLTGYDQLELIGKKVNTFYGKGVEDEKKIMSELMAKGELRNHEMKLKKKDGGLINVNISASLLKNEKGEIIGTLGIYRDIIEKKKLEAQVLQSHKMEAIGTLAGGIAHDFNNLLMGIQGYTSLVLMDVSSTHPHYERLKGIEQQVKSGAELTRQLLGFARGGKYEVKPTNINDLIEKSSTMFARARKEIKIYRGYEKDLWTVEADQGQIEQVLLNLYVNAWQAMPGSGELYLETENVTLDANYVEPYHVEPGKYVKISVKDTGLGMDKETQQRVFDPFFTTKEMGRGTGLGLASVYGIIKNHGGIINVSSEKGKGTTFTIYLPASKKEITEERELTHEVSRGKGTVLLIDDEDMIIDVGSQILKKMGYELLLARGGKEAIQLYKENKDKIDIVILDMIMPDMGGGETYDRMKEINPDIKVLLSSGYSIDGQATQILKRGCNGFIQKPFDIKELSNKIREILDRE
ncbi:MAG: PAS domain S-box protein [Deltaproteobacteria bacterium]|nr:MAG: PAS domain S-box protein [Deltaproteobacteria bacterium]